MVETKTSGMAIASMVLGICSVLLFWVFILDIILGILAVIFGFVALNEIKKKGTKGRGMAIAGVVTGFAGILIVIIAVIAWTAFIVPVMKNSISNMNFTQNLTSNFTQYP